MEVQSRDLPARNVPDQWIETHPGGNNIGMMIRDSVVWRLGLAVDCLISLLGSRA